MVQTTSDITDEEIAVIRSIIDENCTFIDNRDKAKAPRAPLRQPFRFEAPAWCKPPVQFCAAQAVLL